MKKILVCPLDWGLGHATRSIPIIQEFLHQGSEVLIASSGDALALLKIEFPKLVFFELPPYRPEYSSKNSMALKILAQLPKFARVTHAEHDLTEEIVRSHDIDVVVSDNRYGCWSLSAKSIFVSHQTRLQMPQGYGWARPIVNFLLQRYIRRFDEVWIPDQPGSGLTAPFISPTIRNQKYIGWLSRFGRRSQPESKYEVIALVSGPEPQRAIFEKLLTEQLVDSGLKSLLVAGEPGKPYRKRVGNLEIVNHLAGRELEEALVSAEMVVARSGYSTVMDLIALGKRAIFVPTPRQPEQVFLAGFLHENNIAQSLDQSRFSLTRALEKSSQFKGLTEFKTGEGQLEGAIQTLFV
jgi:uncharacterized protein (TIGR00661 family)